MLRTLLLWLPVAALTPAAGPAAWHRPDEDEPDASELVAIELIADRDAVAPGETFRVGVLFRMAPHWHVYWINPGDSGLETEVGLRAPEGFEIGELRFPAPERFVLAGDVINYGYQDEVLLFAELRAPRELPEGPIALEADARWLVCREACFFGEGEGSLALRRRDAGDGPNASAHARRFDKAAARVPRPWSRLEGAELVWSGAEDHPVLEVAVTGASALDFFPLREPSTRLEASAPAARAGGAGLRLAFAFDAAEGESPRAVGVLAVRRGDDTTHYALDTPHPRRAAGDD